MYLEQATEQIRQADIKHQFYCSDNVVCHAEDYGYFFNEERLYVVLESLYFCANYDGFMSRRHFSSPLVICVDTQEFFRMKFEIKNANLQKYETFTARSISKLDLDINALEYTLTRDVFERKTEKNKKS